MDDSQRERLNLLFGQALELPPAARGAFVAGACGEDAALREELTSLLSAYERSSGYFEELAEQIVAPALQAVGSRVDDEFTAGSTVSHYAILERIGGGGMGVVCRARDLRLGRLVALKFLPPRLAGDEPARTRLVAEAKAASALDHPNIGVVYEIGETESGRPFIAMAWYEGETLKEKLARGPLPVAEALDLTLQLAEALAAAHRAGIIHRDVKPANVLVTPEGVAKLVDFGIAKATGAELTKEGTTLGTVAYMSPEQTHGQAVDPRSDLWSLGVLLYEMLAGRRPFRADDEQALIYAIRHDEPEPLARLRPEVPAQLQAIVAACLRKEPARRYERAEELANDLQAAGGAGAERRFLRRHGPPAPERQWRRRWMGAAAAVLLLAGTAGAYLGLGGLERGGESLIGRGVLAERERILLADFTSPTGDTLLAAMATVAFRIDLAQSPVLTLVDTRQVREALGRMQRSDAVTLDLELARELAVREGVKAVLAGEITRSASGYLVAVQLLAPESGEILAAGRQAAADSTVLLPALDRLSKRLRRGIGESLRSVRANAPLERVTTSSLEALRKYSQALRALDVEGDDSRGISLLEEALALDSTFAMAYRKLGATLYNLGVERARWMEALTRAYQYRDRLTQRERYHAIALYHMKVTAEPEKAVIAYRSLLDTYPSDDRALAILGTLYNEMRDWARAEEYFRRSWEADSNQWAGPSGLISAQFNQGKFEEAEATLQRFAAWMPNHWRVVHTEILLAAARGDYARAESLALAERRAWPDDSSRQLRMAVFLAYLAELRGRLEESGRYWHELVELHQRQGRRGAALVSLLDIAHQNIVHHRPERGRQWIERALERHPLADLPAGDRPYLGLSMLFAMLAQPERARVWLAEWEAAVPSEQRGEYFGAQHLAPGQIALAEGRFQDAVREFRLSDQDEAGLRVLMYLARVYEKTGPPDSLLAIQERYIQTPTFFRLHTDGHVRGPFLERLGQLYEARGEHAKAAKRYAEFVELWEDADPELQPRVAEARRRLAALRGGAD